jgi:AcrR family transcriptional regulator
LAADGSGGTVGLTTSNGRKPATGRTAIPNASRARRAGNADDNGTVEKRRGTGRTIRGRETRQRLLDAARVVFERDGFLHARIADICDETGISHGSFYTYFLSKEEVFKEIVDAIELDLLSVRTGPDDRTPIERIRAANRHYLEVYRANADLLSVINQVATFDTEVREARVERHRAFAHAIERRIREYQRERVADRELDPWFAAYALGGMVAAMAEHMFIQRMDDDMELAVEQLTTLWANAIGLRIEATPKSQKRSKPPKDSRPSPRPSRAKAT